MTDIFKEMHDLYMADKQGLRTMITIDDVIQWRRQFGDLLSCDENQRLFADLALSQQEEIQRLRAQLDKWRKGQNTITRSHYLGEIERLRAANKDALAWFEDLKVEFDKVRRELEKANAILAEQEQVVSSIGPITCRNGKIHERFNGCLYCDRDEAFERAAQVCDARQNYEPECPETAAYCADAIRSLKSGEPK